MRAGAELEFAGSPSDQRFSLRAAARILEVPAARLRALARAGFLAPQRGPVGPLTFGFHDLVLLRTTKGLLESGVPMRRIRRVWASLREQLASDTPLTSISVHADGDEVIASDGDARWQPDSGQILLNFDASEIAERAAGAARPAARLTVVEGSASEADIAPWPDLARDERVGIVRREDRAPDDATRESDATAEEWYDEGCDVEGDSPELAAEAYRRALELDPGMADAHVNLGRLLHMEGERGRAEPHYREAARLDPGDPTPHFNLGVLLEEAGRREEAVYAYRQAILRDPDFADAHCNLGLLLESLGRNQEAVRHLMTAHQLNGGSD